MVVALDAGFQKSLQQLSEQLPNPHQNQKQFKPGGRRTISTGLHS